MKLKALAVSVVLAAGLGSAQAATYCSAVAPVTSNGINSVTDFTYRGASANDCYGVVEGNDSAGVINAGTGLWSTNTWVQLVRWNAGNNAPQSQSGSAVDVDGAGPLGNYTFTLNYTGLASGRHGYTLTAVPGADLPIKIDLIGAIKQGNYFSAYLFDNATVDASGNIGSFFTSFGPGTNDFSHFTFYGANAIKPECTLDCGENEIPEPTTLLLLGLGLLGLRALPKGRRA